MGLPAAASVSHACAACRRDYRSVLHTCQIGTPLRGAFKSARLSLNDVNVKLHEHTIFGPAKRREWYEEIMDKQKAEMEKLDRNGSEWT